VLSADVPDARPESFYESSSRSLHSYSYASIYNQRGRLQSGAFGLPITTSITSSLQRLISVLPKAGNPGNRMETRSLQLSGHKTGPVALSAHPPIHIYGNVHSQAGIPPGANG
jgi:hypothetical protein